MRFSFRPVVRNFDHALKRRESRIFHDADVVPLFARRHHHPRQHSTEPKHLDSAGRGKRPKGRHVALRVSLPARARLKFATAGILGALLGNRAPWPYPSSKEERVIAGAADVFLRGRIRACTTMGDIAKRVGISRPSLYLLFANKEEVFAAVIRRLNDDQLAAIRAALPGLPTLHAKVLFACETWGAHGVDLMTAHPDAKDLFDLSFAPVQEISLKFQTLLAELLEGPAAASALGVKPAYWLAS